MTAPERTHREELSVAGARWPAGLCRGRLHGVLLVAVVTALIVLPSLGQRIVATTDEARFVLYAREVLAQCVADCMTSSGPSSVERKGNANSQKRAELKTAMCNTWVRV